MSKGSGGPSYELARYLDQPREQLLARKPSAGK